jgi:UDP-N-acetylenolpyruvoylglucosamine reductase
MLTIHENIDLRPKTTLRIGGKARYYAELSSQEECEEAIAFAWQKNVPLIVLGGGSNTIFADGVINALVIKIKADKVMCHAEPFGKTQDNLHDASASSTLANARSAQHDTTGSVSKRLRVYVQAGKYLANLINELAEHNLDLSPLTGIPGTLGGAIYGNSGQGFGGIWIDRFIESVEVFEWIENAGKWIVRSKGECEFGYRSSVFKTLSTIHYPLSTPLIWSCTLNVPSRPKEEIKEKIERLLHKRIETQPHSKTAGSIFLSKSKDSPAWKLIDAAGLRGSKIGGIEVSSKHANFLMNTGNATFEDAKKMVEKIQREVPEDMTVEMRFINEEGHVECEGGI